MSFPHARELALGFTVVAASLVVAFIVDLLGLFGAGWEGLAVVFLAFASALFVARSFSVGSQMPGFADPHEVYMEVVARGGSERGLTNYKMSRVITRWLWAAAPPLATLILLIAL